MDVSNNTGEDTQYHTGSGTTKIATKTIAQFTWTHLPNKSTHSCADPKTSLPWKIWFLLHDGKTLVAESYDQSIVSVTLVKSGNSYKIEVVKKPVKKPGKKVAPPAKKPVPPTKAVKTAKNSAAA